MRPSISTTESASTSPSIPNSTAEPEGDQGEDEVVDDGDSDTNDDQGNQSVQSVDPGWNGIADEVVFGVLCGVICLLCVAISACYRCNMRAKSKRKDTRKSTAGERGDEHVQKKHMRTYSMSDSVSIQMAGHVHYGGVGRPQQREFGQMMGDEIMVQEMVMDDIVDEIVEEQMGQNREEQEGEIAQHVTTPDGNDQADLMNELEDSDSDDALATELATRK